jgi:hypothetical protein
LRRAGALVLAALPLSVLWFVKWLDPDYQGPATVYLTIGATLWAVVTLLFTFDPHLSAKLGVLKDITQMFRAVDGKKGE